MSGIELDRCNASNAEICRAQSSQDFARARAMARTKQDFAGDCQRYRRAMGFVREASCNPC